MKILKEEQQQRCRQLQQGKLEAAPPKTVVVGVRMDRQGPELLTWALFQVAVAGDRVIALHVSPSSASSVGDASGLFSVISHFESVIAPYEGFCNLKQIELKLKVGRGSSIRKVLVQETKDFAADILVLGVANGSRPIGSSSKSIAKYCAKELPHECSVLAVRNGKIVFQSGAPSVISSESKKASERSSSVPVVHRASLSSNSSKPRGIKDRSLDGLAAIKDQTRKSLGPSISSGSLLGVSRPRSRSVCSKKTEPLTLTSSSNSSKPHGIKDRSLDGLAAIKDQTRSGLGTLIRSGSLLGVSRARSRSVCSKKTEAVTLTSSSNFSKPHGIKDRSLDGLTAIKDQTRSGLGPSTSSGSLLSVSRARSRSVCSKKSEPLTLTSSSIPQLAPVARPGWPLLRRAVIPTDKNSPLERPRGSVFHWAMQLPRRYSSPLAVHPDPKHAKKDANTSSKFDGGSREIVRVENDSSRDEEKKLPKELELLKEKYSPVCRIFSYQELKHATSNFSPDKVVGRGGSSCVYKGQLSDGKEVAVKVLKPSNDALQEFVSDVEIVITLRHKNIVSLHGFCIERGIPILVYDFLSRGSLEGILHDERGTHRVLSWQERYKVAVGVAEALDYLHGGGSPQPVIHRDVKSSNILLDKDFNPQLCDFGLAQWESSSSTTHTTSCDVAGTFGYMAPEYFMYGKVNEKIDVYAFGVVLLELLSGRKPITTGCPKGQENLVIWATTILQGEKVEQVLDPSLGEKYDTDQMARMALAASLCTRRASRSRPRISLILKLLQGDDCLLKWGRSEARVLDEAKVSDEFEGWYEYDEALPQVSNIQSHINLALFDTEDEAQSVSSVEPSVDSVPENASLDDYLKGRLSRSSSFD